MDKHAIPGYEILKEIHRGGQGVVYQALQKSTQRKVAIKIVHGGPFAGPRERARVEREVRILAGLDHPNIVKIHDSGEIPGAAGSGGGTFYYVMDYVSGQSLDAVIGKDPKPVAEVLRLFIEISDAVSAAHLKGVIHRDLKPSNIRLDASGKPHVLDFGLAKLSIPEESDGHKPRLMTMTGQFIGSLPWASPEQALGAPGAVDIRTDVYSIGVMLYQVLTGRFPYPVVGHMREVLDNIMRSEPARPSTVRRQINDEVETIVLKCLAKEPERRYQSAGELARDLRRYLAGEPIEAKRDSGWYFVSKTLRRHRAAVSVAAGFLMLVVVFAGVMGVMWSRERDLRGEAERLRALAEDEGRAKEAARARAQANFDRVRALARVFMEEFAGGIEDLRGATPVRATLLRTAEEALTKLAAEAEAEAGAGGAPNLDLLRELADAHERVGDIEAGLYLNRVGQTAAGAERYAAARAVRERVLAADPGSAASLSDMGESLRRTGQVLQRQRKYADARAEYQQAIARFDAALAAASGGADAARIASRRQQAITGLANLLVTMSVEASSSAEESAFLIKEADTKYEAAEAFWRERLGGANADDDREAARRLGALTDARARAKTTLGRQMAEAAFATGEAGRREEARAELERALGVLASARTLAAGAAGRFEALSASRPQDGVVRRDLLIALYNIGDARMREGDALATAGRRGAMEAGEARERSRRVYLEAVRDFEKAIVVAEELANADASNLEARRDLVLVLNKLGNVVRDLAAGGGGEAGGADVAGLERAAAIFQRSLELREDLWRTDPMEQHRLDLAVGLYKRAEVERLRTGLGTVTGEARRAMLRNVREWLARCVEAYTRLQEGRVAVREQDVARVKRELEEVEAMLGVAGGQP